MSNSSNPIQDESVFNDKESDAALQWCLGLFGVKSAEYRFVPNLIARCYESLSRSIHYAWLDDALRLELTSKFQAAIKTLEVAGRADCPPRGKSNNPADGFLSEFPAVGLACCKISAEHSVRFESLHVMRLLLLLGLLRGSRDEGAPSAEALGDLRRAHTGQLFRDDCVSVEGVQGEDFLTALSKRIEAVSSDDPLQKEKNAIRAILERASPVAFGPRSEGKHGKTPAPEPKAERTRGSSNKKTRKSNRAAKPGSGSQGLRLGGRKLTAKHRVVDHPHDVPEYDFEIVEETPQDFLEISNLDIQADLEHQARAHRHWIRKFGDASPVSRNMFSQLERRRFLSLSQDWLSSEDISHKACALAHLVSYFTSIEAEEFLFNEEIYLEVFDDTGAFYVNTVQIAGAPHRDHLESDKLGFTDSREVVYQVRLALPEFVGEHIAELKRRKAQSFAEALDITNDDLKVSRKKYFRELRQGGRYRAIKSKNVQRQLQLKLDDATGHTAKTFTLSGKSGDMFPVLAHYWRGSPEQLEEAFREALEDLLSL